MISELKEHLGAADRNNNVIIKLDSVGTKPLQLEGINNGVCTV